MTKQPSEPDYDFWMGMASWSKDDAIALAVGMDPDVADWRIHMSDDQNKRVRQIERAIITGVFPNSDLINPRDFLSEMMSNDYEFPKGLMAAAKARKVKIKNWKHAHDAVVAKFEVTSRSDVMSADAKSGSKLPTPRLESCYRIILGVACTRYGYDPKKNYNTATKKIFRDIEKSGIKITDETILSTLRKAYEEVGLELIESDRI